MAQLVNRKSSVWTAAVCLLVGASFSLSHTWSPSLPTLRDPKYLRVMLRDIALRDAKDIPDYLDRLRQVQAVIPEMHRFYKDSSSWLQQYRAKYANRPDLIAKADYLEKLNAYDLRGLQLLEQEVRLGATLAELPSTSQQAFFNEQIIPLQRLEDAAVQDEVKLVQTAKEKGVPLPPDVQSGTPDLVKEYESRHLNK
ncbi:MAG TPA: hypothetical protein VN872_03935 [Candidatus Acidoferrum sp.]|nr:hypothetical protein [Candidatus Acidoferrum sp.]